MALLDRFRAQPRQKHTDPIVRLAFVQELPLEEHEVLAEMAREDVDVRVRRAAVGKLMDPPSLAVVAETDSDETVRALATAMLRDIALEAFEGVTEGQSLLAVDRLNDPKSLAAVAKGAAREPVARRALERVTDDRALGSIARHAAQESIRRAAFEALRDEAEILGVALNSEFKDSAVAAVERVTDRGNLEQIASRSKQKGAAKRARAMIHERDRAAGSPFEAEGEMEALTREAADAGLIPLQEEVRDMQQTEEIPDLHAATAPADVADAAERAAAHQVARDRLEARVALCDRIEALRGATMLDDLALARAEWEGMTAFDSGSERSEGLDDSEVTRRFDEAVRACEQRYGELKESERRRARLAELADEATRLSTGDDLMAARRSFGVVRREWLDISNTMPAEPEIAARYQEAEAKFAAKEAAQNEEAQRVRREALTRLQQLAARVEPLAARTDLSIKVGERALHDIRGALTAIPPLPSRRDYEEIVGRLKAVQSALLPKVQELREVAGWQRWANVGIQEQLCERMEALNSLEDPEQIASQVRALQQQWRQASDVPRAQGELLWKRFKAAHDVIWARCEAYFSSQAQARAENLAKKLVLCERAEALAESTNWIQTADEIKRLQADWKTIGPVPRGQEKAIWERFRTACDRFFTRRHTDLVQRKAIWAENLAKKDALCVKVEQLSESTDWDVAAAEIKRLQAEWKSIGPVKKNRSEAIWQRFRAACDQFFTRYAQRHDIARSERVAAREAICSELETLAGAESAAADLPGESTDQPPGPVNSDLLAKVRALRARWQQEIAARGLDREQARALDERFSSALRALVARYPSVFGGTDLDPASNRKRMEALVVRMEELANTLSGPSGAAADSMSQTTRLAAMLKEALASNTIGGKADEEAKLRAANEEARQAQASWSRIGPVPDEARRALADRFQHALRRIAERATAVSGSSRPGGAGRPGGAPGSGGPHGPASRGTGRTV